MNDAKVILNELLAYKLREKANLLSPKRYQHTITSVKFNDPATIVWFSDGTKVACVCDERDYFDKEKGVLHCIAKKFMGSDEIQRVSVEWEEEKLPFANCGITLYELFGDLLKPEAWDETNQKDLHAFDERGVNNEY